MNSIIKILILCTFSSVTSHVINNQSVSSKGVIIGPKTPVFYLTFPQPDYLKVNRVENKFNASPAYNYYSDPTKRDSVLFISILVILNSYLYSWYQPTIFNDIVENWNEVSENFDRLDTPKIKIVISGVVVPEVPNLWNPERNPDDFNDSLLKFRNYEPPTIVENIENWFNDNADQFERLSYDMFVYMSTYFYGGYSPATIEWSRIVPRDICKNNDNDKRSVAYGGVASKDGRFNAHADLIIGASLGIPYDDQLKCGRGYFMDKKINMIEDWSECSKMAFKNFTRSKFDCLKNFAYDTEEEDEE